MCEPTYHVTWTGAPTLTPSIAEALSSTIASSRWPVEPMWAMNVIGGWSPNVENMP